MGSVVHVPTAIWLFAVVPCTRPTSLPEDSLTPLLDFISSNNTGETSAASTSISNFSLDIFPYLLHRSTMATIDPAVPQYHRARIAQYVLKRMRQKSPESTLTAKNLLAIVEKPPLPLTVEITFPRITFCCGCMCKPIPRTSLAS